MAKKTYTINEKSKTISCDFTKLSEQEKFEVEMLVKAGYRPTSKRNTGKTTKNKEYYLEALKGNEEALAEFNRLRTTVKDKEGKVTYKGSFLRAARYANGILDKK